VTKVDDIELVGDFERLRNICIDLQVLTNEFRALFDNADKPTLDAVGSAVFPVIHECMIEAWWLRVGRLMDPKETGTKKNLSIENIVVRTVAVHGADSEVAKTKEELRVVFDKMKDSRDKQVAHNDLLSSREGKWLSNLTETDAKTIENGIQKLCNLLGSKLGVGPLDFRASGCEGDANDLKAFLHFGLRARDAWDRSNPGSSTTFRGMYRDR
jgi:hypothetical protein